jgi:hypothetical protein
VLVADRERAAAVRAAAPDVVALVADEALQTDLRMFLIEVLGPFDGIALPLALVLAPGAELVALHFEAPDVERLLGDLRTAAAPADVGTTLERLAGGRWIARPERSLGSIT